MKKAHLRLILFLMPLVICSCRKDVYENTWLGEYLVNDTLKVTSPFGPGGSDTIYRSYSITMNAHAHLADVALTNVNIMGDTCLLVGYVVGDTIHVPAQEPIPHSSTGADYSYALNGYRRNDSVFFSATRFHPLGDPPAYFWGVAKKL